MANVFFRLDVKFSALKIGGKVIFVFGRISWGLGHIGVNW